MRSCPDCQSEKPTSDFGRASPRCRGCAVLRRKKKVKEARDRLYERHPDYRSRANKKFYAEHRESQRARARIWRQKNPDKVKRATKAWREANKEAFSAIQKSWREANRGHLQEYRRVSYAENRERDQALARLYKSTNKEDLACKRVEYLRMHPEINRYLRSLNRAGRATPAWADKKKIRAIYASAVDLSIATGVPHHVDHIYPLKSEVMCGLHCEANLQVLTATENRTKRNRIPENAQPEMR